MRIGTEIALSLSGVTLDLSLPNLRDGLGVTRRLVVEHQPRVEYGATGLPKRLARWYEPKNVWAFALSLSGDEFDTLEWMRLQQQRLVKSGNPFALLLDDARLSHVEASQSPTRAVVPGSVALADPLTGTAVEYYARFQVLLNFGEQFYRRASLRGVESWLVDFSAVELEKVAP